MPSSANTPDLPGMVAEPTVTDLPAGYKYAVTRYADLVLRDALPELWDDLVTVLTNYHIEMAEITVGGGGRAVHTKRFDESLYARGWGKRNITLSKLIDGKAVYQVRGHEIDVFKMGPNDPYPGVAVEMEWSNKDPFYHRDLTNFMTLNREGVIAVGVIVTRGPNLQSRLERLAAAGHVATSKYGRATTHWNKLIPMVNLGAGGECPLLLIGIEDDRVNDWLVD